MTEHEIIQEFTLRSRDPKRATSAAGWNCNWEAVAKAFPPVSLETLHEAEARFAIPLPSLLKRIWTEVANGGVGPVMACSA